MKLAVFSDIHGNYQALEAILKDIESKNIDETIFLGDAVALGPNSNECVKLLLDKNVKYILGNHEHYLIKTCSIDPDMEEEKIEHHLWVNGTIDKSSIEKLNKLKNSYQLTINNKIFTFIHFFLEETKKYPFKHLSVFKNNEYLEIMNSFNSDYTFYGHHHDGRYDKVNDKEFYGIGSSGCSKDDNTYYYLIDTDNLKIDKIIIKYDRNKLIEAINNSNYPHKTTIKKNFFGI